MVSAEMFTDYRQEIVGSSLTSETFFKELQDRQGDPSFWDTVIRNIDILRTFHLVDPAKRFGTVSASDNAGRVIEQGFTIEQLLGNATLARDFATGVTSGESIESGYETSPAAIFGKPDFAAYLDALSQAQSASAVFSRDARNVYARVVEEYRAQVQMLKSVDSPKAQTTRRPAHSGWKAAGASSVGVAILTACGAQAITPTVEVSPKPAETAVIPTKVSSEAMTHTAEIAGGGSFAVVFGKEYEDILGEEFLGQLRAETAACLPMVDANSLTFGYMGKVNEPAAAGTVGGVVAAQDKDNHTYIIARVVADHSSELGAHFDMVCGRVSTYKSSGGDITLRYYDPHFGGAEQPLFIQSSTGEVAFYADKNTPVQIEAKLQDVTEGVKLASLDTDAQIFSMQAAPADVYEMRVQYSVSTYVDWEKQEAWVSVLDANTEAYTYARIPMKDDGTLYDTWTDESGRIVVGDKKENVVKFVQVDLTVQNAAANPDGSELAVTRVQFEPPEIAQLIADGATFKISPEGILTAYDKDGNPAAESYDANNWRWKFQEPVARIDLEKYAGIEVRTALASPAELASLPDVTDLVVTPDVKPNQEFLAWLDLLSAQGQLGQPENLAEIAGHEFGPATFMKWPKPRDIQEVLDSGRGAPMFCITDAELTAGTYANPERRPIYKEAYFQIHDANGRPYLFWTEIILGADGNEQRIPYVASFAWVKEHWTDDFDAHSRYMFMPIAFPPDAQLRSYNDKKAYAAFIEPTASETWQAARAWWDSDQIKMPDWMDDYFWSPSSMITSFQQ